MKLQLRNKRAAKLTAEDVRTIRRLYEAGNTTHGQIARDFGISAIQVGRILRFESWAEVTQERSLEEINALGQRLLAEAQLQEKLDAAIKEARAEMTPGETKADKEVELLKGYSPEALARFKEIKGE